jgi:hypothetical protein
VSPGRPAESGGDRESAPSPSQALFREVNDQIREIARRWDRRNDLEVLCECETGCLEHLRIPISEYEAVRRFPGRFVVRPTHVVAAERIVESTDGYAVVEKGGPNGSKVTLLDRQRAWRGEAGTA